MRAIKIGVCPTTRAHALLECTVSGARVAEYRCASYAHADLIGGAFVAVGAVGASEVYRAVYGANPPELP